MCEEPYEPTEEISLNKDQADCLLICLTLYLSQIKSRRDNAIPDEEVIVALMSLHNISKEEAIDAIEEQKALDKSIEVTIPTILAEIKEIYPVLQERSDPASRIIIQKPPLWKPHN